MNTARGLWEREAESAAIVEVLKEITHGGGTVLLVEGPAGIGKTRLLAEVRAAAAKMGAGVASARGAQLERDFAFGVVRQMFEPLLADAGPAEREALWQGPAAQARQVFETVGPATQPTGDFAVLHGLYWLTANASQNHPLVLLMDDLQWCDAPSLRYLAYLLPRIEDLGVLVAAALRTGESATDERLFQQITTCLASQVLQPRPLSAQGTALLLRQALPNAVDPQFAAACHKATGGNPLLLRELARTLTAEGIKGRAENATLVRDLGSRAVARLVAGRMAHLPRSSIALARAAAVLGDQADLTTAAALIDQDTTTTLEGAAALERLQILRVEQHHAATRLAFIHPLVQAAVQDTIDHADRARAHHDAAQLLAAVGADPERIAAHLLHTPPTGDPDTVTALRAAATEAAARGAPQAAVTYLERCASEPLQHLSPTERLPLLVQLGTFAQLVDLTRAAGYLEQALRLGPDIRTRAQVAWTLGNALSFLGRSADALTTLFEGVEQLPRQEQDLRRRLESAIIWIGIMEPGGQNLSGRSSSVRDLPDLGSVGDRALDCVIAYHDAILGDPSSISRAVRGLAGNLLADEPDGAHLVAAGWSVLMAADHEHAIQILTEAIARAHRLGSLATLAPAYNFRGLGRLWQGALAEAETDLREGMRAIEMIRLDFGLVFNGPYLADVLMERGLLAEAASVLGELPGPSDEIHAPMYHLLESRARLLRLRGRMNEALETAMTAGRTFADHGGKNPAFVAWRSETALALHALDRVDEALEIAAEELRLARRWGSPRALGRALRVRGLVQGGGQGMALLQDAVSVLEHSPARLEYAKALAALGAAVRRTGHPQSAREPLRRALDLATRCGATPLADQARTELAAAGGWHTTVTGPNTLTPSERRVADLAARGDTNRQIAQTLFVTPKTVEVHLSAAYRKLGITARTQLAQALPHPDSRQDL